MSQSSPTQVHRAHLRVVTIGEETPVYDAPERARPEPFAMIPCAVFDKLSGDGFALAVYAVLAKHAGREGECWPSVTTICEAVGWSKPTVIKTLKRLRETGVIESETRWSKGSVTANIYRLPFHPPVNQIDSTGKARLPVPVNDVDLTGKPGLPKLDTTELNPKELTKKTAKKPRVSSPDTPVPENLVDLIPADVWAAMRNETRLTDDQLRFETALMIDRNLRKGGTSKNWVASWRSWMRSPYRQSQPKATTPGKAEMPPEIRALPWNSAARLKWENDHRGAS